MATATIIPTDTNRVSKPIDLCRNREILIISELPFKIRITNIKVPGYNPTNVPPIGIAIIGLNNYIL